MSPLPPDSVGRRLPDCGPKQETGSNSPVGEPPVLKNVGDLEQGGKKITPLSTATLSLTQRDRQKALENGHGSSSSGLRQAQHPK